MKIPTESVEILPNLFVTKDATFYTIKTFLTKPSIVVKPAISTQTISESKRGKVTGKLPQGSKCVWHQGKHHFVHRLVGKAFIPNPENKPQINHIDGNRHNNDVSNLEWNTAQENIQHARQNNLTNNDWAFKAVCKYDSTGELIATYPSLKQAAECLSRGKNTQMMSSSISHHIRNYGTKSDDRYYHTYGYQWRYANDTESIQRFVPRTDLKSGRRKVHQIDPFSNKVVKEHDSHYIAASYFSSEITKGASAIYNAIRKDAKSYGFRWAYA